MEMEDLYFNGGRGWTPIKRRGVMIREAALVRRTGWREDSRMNGRAFIATTADASRSRARRGAVNPRPRSVALRGRLLLLCPGGRTTGQCSAVSFQMPPSMSDA